MVSCIYVFKREIIVVIIRATVHVEAEAALDGQRIPTLNIEVMDRRWRRNIYIRSLKHPFPGYLFLFEILQNGLNIRIPYIFYDCKNFLQNYLKCWKKCHTSGPWEARFPLSGKRASHYAVLLILRTYK